MDTDNSMHLRPSARLQKYLGRELIGDPNLAVLEFVKNAYDAGANEVTVAFSLSTSPSTLTISDDGIGMDEAAFRENWLRPGFSKKSPDYAGSRQAPTTDNAASVRAGAREPAGEKGLGRLGSGRLGDRMDVWTRQSASDDWLHVIFDWSSFEDMQTYMDAVPIPFAYESPTKTHLTSGTIVQITQLRQAWAGRVPGRPVAGRPRTRLGRLRQDLELLVRPLGATDANFAISLESDSFTNASDVGRITPTRADSGADYEFRFTVGMDAGGYVVVSRTLQRSAAIVDEFSVPPEVVFSDLVINDRVAREKSRPATLHCGHFSGTFLYTPPPKAKRAREIDSLTSGVLLYRDGILVEPYGMPGNDWVGVEARKASRQGHAAIQPQTFSGFVRITRRENPDLEEMSNRLGLLDNEASDDLFGHVRAEFAFFEELVYEEVLRGRWSTKEEKASKAASKSASLARVRTRALVHSIGQPLQALGLEVLRLEYIRLREDVPPDVRKELISVQEHMESYLDRLGATVQRFADFSEPELAFHSLANLARQGIEGSAEFARLKDVDVSLRIIRDSEVLVPEELVVDSIQELISNAIEVQRGDGVEPEVSVSIGVDGQRAYVQVEDNGVGLPGLVIPPDLTAMASRSGRPSEGMATIVNAMSVCTGELSVLRTSATGTVFQIFLPTRLSDVSGEGAQRG